MGLIKFNKWIKSYNESLKNDKLNNILSKISDGTVLSQYEKNFLDNYESIQEEDLKDYTLLNCSDTYDKVSNILSKGRKVNYQDKEITDIRYIKDDICVITPDGNIPLLDKYLYDIINNEDGSYTLCIQDEYFEKLPLKND
jgi:hypothetical protein